jgi:hypothetical protein
MRKLSVPIAVVFALVALVSPRAQSARVVALDSATTADLNAAFDAGTLSSEQLVT